MTTENAFLRPIYLKLGGSLITDKRQAETPRLAVIQRLAGEIAAARAARPDLALVIGHGSGSFGHVVGQQYGTRQGVQTLRAWYGFAATGDAAARLNRIVTAALLAAGIPAWSLQPSVALRCQDGQIVDGPAQTVAQALAAGLVPVLYGDVALDSVRGGTIASTEEIFEWLAPQIPPQQIVLAGEVAGVYTSDPQKDPQAQPIALVTPHQFDQMQNSLGGSFGTDVTGGMAAKIAQAIRMVQRDPHLTIHICSGLEDGVLLRALTGEKIAGSIVRQTGE